MTTRRTAHHFQLRVSHKAGSDSTTHSLTESCSLSSLHPSIVQQASPIVLLKIFKVNGAWNRFTIVKRCRSITYCVAHQENARESDGGNRTCDEADCAARLRNVDERKHPTLHQQSVQENKNCGSGDATEENLGKSTKRRDQARSRSEDCASVETSSS
ncbi:hypothetical protein BLNAU_24120 [Blattamonas nauphoetae]|uniref:Uncharacterized protein n=1 Tax=Blattamonas nauphoetae TaxID=2049346 RepID=A0ABQ9WNC0_9EUKA|nr:hypothetical protein BLNAU_24120 [Blattamonas nauphoetae]